MSGGRSVCKTLFNWTTDTDSKTLRPETPVVKLRLYFGPKHLDSHVQFFVDAVRAAVRHIFSTPGYLFSGVTGTGVEVIRRPGGRAHCIQVSLSSSLTLSEVQSKCFSLAPRGIINDGLMTLLPTSFFPFPLTAIMFLDNQRHPLFYKAMLTDVPSAIANNYQVLCDWLNCLDFFPDHEVVNAVPYVDEYGIPHADQLSVILKTRNDKYDAQRNAAHQAVPSALHVEPFKPMPVYLCMPFLPDVLPPPMPVSFSPPHAPSGRSPSSPPPAPHVPSGTPGASSPTPPPSSPPPPSSSSAPKPAAPVTFKDAVRGAAASTSGRVPPLAMCPVAVVDSSCAMLTDPITGHKRSAPSACVSSAEGSIYGGDTVSLISEGTAMQQPGA